MERKEVWCLCRVVDVGGKEMGGGEEGGWEKVMRKWMEKGGVREVEGRLIVAIEQLVGGGRDGEGLGLRLIE